MQRRETVGPQVLFNGVDIYDLVEEQRDRFEAAYEAVPDDKALDEEFAKELKQKFMLDVPIIRIDDWTSDRQNLSAYSTEVIV
jgi:hypothetical protein